MLALHVAIFLVSFNMLGFEFGLKVPGLFMLPAGDWEAQFDTRFTSRGVFYLDDVYMVDVDVMEDAKHPLSLFIDNDLDAQVEYNVITQSV